MKAVVHDRYGPPEVLRLEEVERPVPKDDEVLVRIHATTVNRTDAGLRSAEVFISRFVTGLLRPKNMWHVPFLLLATRWVGSRKLKMGIARYQKVDLLFLKGLIEAGEYRAVIDRTYPLEDVIEATRYVETEQKTGNVVLTVA
jgi:NADPH:quinone reductase-like Zn-dependent oxidoreductase